MMIIYEDGEQFNVPLTWLVEHDERVRADAIEEVCNKSFCEFSICEDCAMFGQYDEYGEKEVCILLKLKEQKNE